MIKTTDTRLLNAISALLSFKAQIATILCLVIWQLYFDAPTALAQHTEGLSVQQLEDRGKEIDEELVSLAQYSLRSGVGAIGFRSQTHPQPTATEWFQIEFDNEYEINAIVLVPTIRRDANQGFLDDALAQNLKFVLGTEPITQSPDQTQLPQGSVVASFDKSDSLSPRIAPIVVELDSVKAKWIRVEATNLKSREFDGLFIFQFSELMAFAGSVNVASDRPVTASSNVSSGSPAWDKDFAVDGFVPYLMNGSNEENKSFAYVSEVGVGDRPQIFIDLEKEHPVSEIRLHLVDQGDTVPQTFAGDFGMPGQLLIEGSKEADFSDAVELLDYRHEDNFDIGPIISRRVPETSCRYIRLTAINPFVYDFGRNNGTRIAVSEFEVLANGKNVAIGKEVSVQFESVNPHRMLTSITDGNNRYGEILPTLEWMKQLARRHDLERERPVISQALKQRYQQQRQTLNRLIGLAALLVLVTLAAVLIGWNLRYRAVQRVRERIAADLHDELGANFHAIGLLSDLAQNASESPEKLKPLLARIRELTERTGKATAYSANMLESVGLFDDLEEDMRRAAARIIADLDKELTFEGQQNLEQLGPKQRIDLFLFYKESLVNIIRHSGATRVSSHLRATPRELNLKIVDNGQGIPHSFANGVPPSLNRRARLLGASVKAITADSGGTELELKLRLGRRWPLSVFASNPTKTMKAKS